MTDLRERLAAAVSGAYAVEHELGSGGMASVYLARDLKHGRPVALKVLLPELSAAVGGDRFLSEVRVTANLQHPNILPLFDSGEADGLLYYVMPVVEGESLQERLEREKQMAIDEAIRITTAVASALDYAHRQNVIHRDIKPANILLRDEQVFVTDFGIALAVGGTDAARITATGLMVGTPQYMSPEQAGGDQTLTAASDIYSLGSVLYELLAGVPPHTGPNIQAIVAKVFTEAPVPLRSLRTTVPDLVERVVAKALAKAPADRFVSASEFARALASPDSTVIVTPSGVSCPSCQHENSSGASFCGKCGTAMEATCGGCGAALPVDAGFCGRCGKAVAGLEAVDESTPGPDAAMPGRAESERRHITFVQTAFDGYATLLEHLDAENVERFMDRLREGATEIVTRHGGILNTFSPDELVALFGVPAAHEDDAVSATRAAVELHRFVSALGSERDGSMIRARTGIGTGMAIATSSRRDGEHYSIAGAVAKIAARLALQAEVNDVLVSAETEHLLSPFFTTESLDPIALGAGGPAVKPHRVLSESGVRTRLEAAAQTGLTRFAGRDAEMRTLEACLRQALQGEGQVVSVVGEAGVGKSRLRYEFRQTLDSVDVRVVEGRCQVLSDTTPYLPFIEAMRSVFGLTGGGDGEHSADPVIANIRAVDANLEDFIPLYLYLLSLQSEAHPYPEHLTGENLRLAILESLSAAFTVVAAQRPLVMFLEDWHWSDEASQDMLKQLAGMVVAFPILIVVTARPERVPDVGGAGQHTQVQLGPVAAAASTAIIASVLQVDRTPDGLGERLHSRTSGNPFFLEELCHAMQEEGLLRVEAGEAILTGGVESLQLPDTVQAVLRSRLDRVDPDPREVLRVASVVGREFSRKILDVTLPESIQLVPSIETLKSLGMIQQIRVLPEPAYRFKHALTQEVAYESLVQHRRKTLHGSVGGAIEELYPDRVDEQPDVLAHHFSLAEQWAAAVRYGRRAAEKAHDLTQFADELRLLDNVSHWMSKLEPNDERRVEQIDVLLARERVYESVGDRERQQGIVDELLALIQPTEDKQQLAETLIRQGDLYTLLGRFERGRDALSRSLQIWRDLADRFGERKAMRSLGFLHWHNGDHELAIRASEEALAIDRELGDFKSIAMDLNSLALALKSAGQTDRAVSCLEEAVRLTAEKGLEPYGGHAFFSVSVIYRERGDGDRAMEYLKRAHEINRRYGRTREESYTLAAMATVALDQGNSDEAVRIYEDLVRRMREVKYAAGLIQGLQRLSELLLALERPMDALPYLRESAEVLERMGERSREALARKQLAEIYEYESHDYKAASTGWARVLQITGEIGDPRLQLESLESLGRLSRVLPGEEDGALGYLEKALALAESLDDVEKQGNLLNTLGVVRWQQKDYGGALSNYRQALAIYRDRDDQIHAGLVLNSIGVVLRDSGRLEDALEPLQEALETNRRSGQRRLEAHSLAILGDVFSRLEKRKEALVQYEASLAIRREIDDRGGEGWMLLRIAQVEACEERWDQALDYVGQARRIADEVADEQLKGECDQIGGLTAT